MTNDLNWINFRGVPDHLDRDTIISLHLRCHSFFKYTMVFCYLFNSSTIFSATC
jgi:hypothetical protein